MRKLCPVLMLCLVSLFFSGYTAPKQTTYFTIYFDNEKIVVGDKYLKPAWYNQESYAKHKPIYERDAKDIKNFPELLHIIKKIEAQGCGSSSEGRWVSRRRKRA